MAELLTHPSIAGKPKQVKCHADPPNGHQVLATMVLFWLEKGQGKAPAALSKAANA